MIKKAKLHVNLETQSWGTKGFHYVLFFVTRQKTVLDLKDKGLSKANSNSFTFIVILLCSPLCISDVSYSTKIIFIIFIIVVMHSVYSSIFLVWTEYLMYFFLKIQTQNEHHINVHKSCAKGNSVLEFHKQADLWRL